MSLSAPPLLLDLYELTMGSAYFELGMRETAVFELFVRRLPRNRRFLISAGLSQVIEYLETLRFSEPDLAFLETLQQFPKSFLDHLARFRFTGSVHAMPEGAPFFENEPILRITAPILEAQIVESRIMNLMHFQSMIASKAIRCVMVAGGRRLIDFGMRRAHGAEAALLAARAAFLAGFDATATVEAGRVFGIPLSGTMAHSFVQAHDREEDAFRNFAKTYAGDATLLVDTYNTEHGVALAAELAREMKAATQLRRVRAVRIDSGDLAAESLSARRALNAQGCDDVQIVLSGNLDEYRIQSLLAAGAPVDAFGVGTSLTVSSDSPSLDVAYKLVEYAGRARLKRSTGKTTWPGPKQVYRELTENGVALRDHVVLAEEATPGQALLKEVMRAGQRVDALPTLQESRSYCRECVAQLPESLRSIEEASPAYEVRISESLQKLARTR